MDGREHWQVFCRDMANSDHRTTSGRRLVWLFVVAWLAMSASVATAAPQSVADFLALKAKWDDLVGSRFQLEGRVSTGSGRTLKLTSLPLFFQSAEELPDLGRKATEPPVVVEVSGVLTRDANQGLYFILSRIKRVDDDLTQLNRAIIDIPRNEPDKWYELARRTQLRAAFYEDTELAAAALDLLEKGLQREEAQLKQHNLRSYRQLADKARQFGLPAARATQLLYRGHYYDWQSTSGVTSAAELSGSATGLSRDLPGAEIPLGVVDEELRTRWSTNAVSLYDEMDVSARRSIHRFLFLAMMLEAVNKMADSTGKNGLEVADFIEKLIPEYASRAGEFRDKYRQWRLSQVDEMSREEMLALRDEFLKLGDEASARTALDHWFKNREALLRKRGPNGLVELAAEYEALQENGERMAVQLLLQAERERPGSEYVAERLQAYGYRKIDGKWNTEAQVEAIENSPLNQAMREGRIVSGMTVAQVQKIHGKPDAVTRVLTTGRVIEYWVYHSGATRLSIRLSRPAGQAVSIVNAVSELPAAL